MNIYFSGSIKGGRQLVDRYALIIDRLKQYGIVLTEHIGDKNYAKSGYQPADYIYNRDVGFLNDSQVVVAEVTVASLGVGYELAYAESKGIPCLCLSESSANVSSMIIGDSYFTCKQYTNEEEMLSIIDEYFKNNFRG